VTRDEHRNIIAFINSAVQPEAAQAAAPLDVEADAIIRALFVRNPEAAYRVTMLAMAQREDLAALKAELAETRSETGKGWFSRLLQKIERPERTPRRDPELSMFPQNARGR
jgi:hypothetical protein